MKFSLHVSASPFSSQSHLTALHFAEAIALSEHALDRVFFSGDGVYIGNRLVVPPQGEEDIRSRWIEVAQQCDAELVLCVSASLKRGIIDETEAARYEKSAFTTSPPFIISGLGQLIEAGITADRLVTFGE